MNYMYIAYYISSYYKIMHELFNMIKLTTANIAAQITRLIHLMFHN
jgi:hypothetical protein